MSFVRVAGAVLLACGLALASLIAWAIGRQFICDCLAGNNLVVILLLAFPCAFCTLMGYRLAFARPNQYGSLLAPWAWVLLALGFLAIGILLVARSKVGAVEWFVAGLAPALLALACLVAMRNAVRRPEQSAAFLAQAANRANEDAWSSGDFQVGIEILNDDKTPMEFVVAMLESHLHLSRPDAVRAMLAIHTKGKILVPLGSMEESVRVAGTIVSEARAQGHPLACRAVNGPNGAG